MNFNKCELFVFVILILTNFTLNGANCRNLEKRNIKNTIQCLEDSKFYRNPHRSAHKVWTNIECAKYYLCLDGEVFEFKCSVGLLFDVIRQICDFKQNVENCDITAEPRTPKPLLENTKCMEENQLGCADGVCLPNEYFCDGSIDCNDGSDEGWCDVDNDPNAAEACDTKLCQLPDCFCSKDGTIIPNRLDPKQVPQMILLTFDDAVNSENFDLYTKQIFTKDRKNPNGCPIHGTFYVSHQYTNYQHIQKLWNDQHEISIHSITHRGPEQWWSHNATIEDWFDEMVGQANIINKFGNVRMEDLRGLRVPFLRIGWNRQFLMMKEFGFVYDASMIAPFSNPPLWPYTMDYKMPHPCTGNNQNCPSRSYPGIWEIVMNQLESGEYNCGMVDSCPPHLSPKDVYDLLIHNFHRHYQTNRAPYGLYFHSTWFKKPQYKEVFQTFVDEILKLPDVYFVTNWQAIEWIRKPTVLSQLNQFTPWYCNTSISGVSFGGSTGGDATTKQFEPHEIACNLPNTCKLHSRVLQQERYFYTCNDCPEQYPWIRNEFGLY